MECRDTIGLLTAQPIQVECTKLRTVCVICELDFQAVLCPLIILTSNYCSILIMATRDSRDRARKKFHNRNKF